MKVATKNYYRRLKKYRGPEFISSLHVIIEYSVHFVAMLYTFGYEACIIKLIA